jgi:hypothetical protein
MALVIPDGAEVEWGKRCLYSNAGSENLTLKLFSNSITPAESDVAATYTEATFTGYVAKTLTSSQSGATWAVPTTSSGTTTSTYGTNMNWLPTTSETIYGLYIIFTTSTLLAAAEAFGAPKGLANGDSLTIVPSIAFA